MPCPEEESMKKSAAPSTKNSQIPRIDRKYIKLFEELRKSDQEKAVILDAMTELVIYLDSDLKVIWANKAMREFFNLRPGQLNGKYCYKALHNRSRACSVCPAKRTLETGEPHDVVDISSYKKNWVLRSYPVRDEKGSLSGVVEIVTDITERRRAEEAMRQSEQKYRELFENANDIIFVFDFNGRILSCNAAAYSTYGYEPGQMLGLSLEALLDKKHLPVVRELFGRKRGEVDVPNPLEFLTYTRNGEAVWVEVNTRSVRENGKPVAIHGIARNITERKRMEEALKKREQELEEKSRNLEDANTALRVLLKRREDDKAELEEKVICNVRELILPYIENLKITPVDSHQLNQLKILERNTNEIISPFLRTLSSKYPNLTPMEIKVINFIREGRTTKEMAELLNASARTVEVHRDNIRKKMGLRNRKANLKSYLMAL
jgi:PAS domain S-box-containing protein